MDGNTSVAERRPVLKIQPEEKPVLSSSPPQSSVESPERYKGFTYEFSSLRRTSTASDRSPTTTKTPTFLASAQGSHCCGCGGMFVISNRCSNRDCKHLQCSMCQ